MIKLETIGEIQRVVSNPVLKSDKDVKNHSILKLDGATYLINNTPVGDNAYMYDFVIPAGEYLNGYDLSSLAGQKLVIDAKHIKGDAKPAVGATLVADEDGSLKAGTAESGISLTVTDINVTLTEKGAVKAVIAVA